MNLLFLFIKIFKILDQNLIIASSNNFTNIDLKEKDLIV